MCVCLWGLSATATLWEIICEQQSPRAGCLSERSQWMTWVITDDSPWGLDHQQYLSLPVSLSSSPVLPPPPPLLLSFFLSSSPSLALSTSFWSSSLSLQSRSHFKNDIGFLFPLHFYLFYFTNCATARLPFSSELTRSKLSWNKAELAAQLLSHIPTSIATHFFLTAHSRITFYQHSINLSPRWENGHAIVLQPAIVFGLNTSQPACAFFFSSFGVIFFIVVQPHEETLSAATGASAVYGRGKQGLAAPRNKWLDYLKPLPRSNSNT